MYLLEQGTHADRYEFLEMYGGLRLDWELEDDVRGSKFRASDRQEKSEQSNIKNEN